MWNFTDAGFTSVVEYNPPATQWSREQNKHVQFDDGIINKLPSDYHPADKETLSSHVLVRARIQEDLAVLRTYDPDGVETEMKTADYQFRLVMRRTAYAQFMYDKVMTIDYYSHVKETIDKRAPQIAGGRYSALSQIWSACAHWQPNRPWGGTVSYGGYGPTVTYDSATSKQTGGTYSYWDKSLGKWITPKNQSKWTKEVVAPGGAGPKAISGTGAKEKSDSASSSADWPSEATLDRILDGVDPDNPWLNVDPWVEPSATLPLGETEDGLRVSADATRSTMIAQVKDFVRETGSPCEVEALVDALQDSFGTVDVDTIPQDVLLDMADKFESVNKILAAM